MADFRSDTKTKPTAGMRAAMAAAEVGDEQSDEDPTTNALCDRVAGLLGKEAAVFLPSGTMANEIAIRVHCRPGEEIIAHRDSHIVNFEGGGPAALSGTMVRTVGDGRGQFDAETVAAAVRLDDRYHPRSRLVAVEQTANIVGGTVWPVALLDSVAEAGRAHGLATHMDGARLLNAVVASGRPAADHARGFDSVWIDFSKGLGAPVGAVLAGDAAFIHEAWRFKQQWGGAMRQSGVLAGACLYALDHHVDRLADDHRRAATIAQRLAGSAGIDSIVAPDTNIVILDLAADGPTAEDVVERVGRHGVRIGDVGPRRIRIVTHLDVDDADVDALCAAWAEVLG